MSDKYVTIGIKATKDVRKALDMLQKELSGGLSLKALFERMLHSYGISQIGFFKRMAEVSNAEILGSEKELQAIDAKIASETNEEKKKELEIERDAIDQKRHQFWDYYQINWEMVEFYSRFLSTAFPSKAYPDDINEPGMFAEVKE